MEDMSHNSCSACQPPRSKERRCWKELRCFGLRHYICSLISGYLSTNLPFKNQIKFRVLSKAALDLQHLTSSLCLPNVLITAPCAFSICSSLFTCCLSLWGKKVNNLRFVNFWSQIYLFGLPVSIGVPCVQYLLNTCFLIVMLSLEQWFSKCGPYSSSNSITWKLVRTTCSDPQVPPGTCWIRNSEGGIQQ